MRRSFTGLLAAAAVGGLMAVGSATPAAAQVANPGAAFATPNESLTTNVQYRRGWRGGRGGYGRRYGYRRGGGRGASIGAGIAGLAAGAIIGGAIASQAAPAYGYGPGPAYDGYGPGPAYGGNADAYCASRYRSYDPGSGTYLNYDGNRYPCP